MATGGGLSHTNTDKVARRNKMREQLAAKLADKGYRHLFVSEQINTGLAFQLRAMREARGWTQAELGRRAGMAQARVSLMEDANYSRFSLNTLKRLASALDVALDVRFEAFSDLVDRFVKLDSSSLNVPSYEGDVFIADPPTDVGAVSNVLATCYLGEATLAGPYSGTFSGTGMTDFGSTFSLQSTPRENPFTPLGPSTQHASHGQNEMGALIARVVQQKEEKVA